MTSDNCTAKNEKSAGREASVVERLVMSLLSIALQVICGLVALLFWDVIIADIGAVRFIAGWMIATVLIPEIAKYFRT